VVQNLQIPRSHASRRLTPFLSRLRTENVLRFPCVMNLGGMVSFFTASLSSTNSYLITYCHEVVVAPEDSRANRIQLGGKFGDLVKCGRFVMLFSPKAVLVESMKRLLSVTRGIAMWVLTCPD